MLLKKIIRKIIKPSYVVKTKRVLYFLLSGKRKIQGVCNIETLSYGYHTTCGYYDFDPVRNNRLLFITSGKKYDKVNVVLRDLLLSKNEIVAVSNLLNWQQGNRLQWKTNDSFIYNSFVSGKYVSIEQFTDGKRIVHKWPVYDIFNDFAVSVDFNRLGWMRPGYGYTNFPLADVSVNDCAIKVFNMINDSLVREITYKEIIDALNVVVDVKNCYVNHLKFSPKGDKFLFFFIEKKASLHMCYLGVFENNKVSIIEKKLSASHYVWKNDNVILTTSYDDKRNCRYYFYDISQNKRYEVMSEKLQKDGHPTFVNDYQFITDSYPDREGFQHIYLVDLRNNNIEEMVSIYSSAKHLGVERCDLHPRYAKEIKEVFFDADIDGRRRVYSFKIS